MTCYGRCGSVLQSVGRIGVPWYKSCSPIRRTGASQALRHDTGPALPPHASGAGLLGELHPSSGTRSKGAVCLWIQPLSGPSCDDCGGTQTDCRIARRNPRHTPRRGRVAGYPALVPGIDPRWDWRNVLTGEPVVFAADDGQPTLALAELLGHCPVALPRGADGFMSCAASQSPHQGWQQKRP